MTEWDFLSGLLSTVFGGGLLTAVAELAVLALLILVVVQAWPGGAKPLTKMARGIGKAINGEISERLSKIDARIGELEKAQKDAAAKAGEKDTLDARNRILRFDDECRRGVRHSEELFDQILEDVDLYERYCAEHPKFPNSKCTQAVAHIKKVYAQCREEDDFA